MRALPNAKRVMRDFSSGAHSSPPKSFDLTNADRAAELHAILESALDGIITADQYGRVTEFNPAAERTFGYRREDVLGRPLVEVVVPPSLRAAHDEAFARSLATTGEAATEILAPRVELIGMRADGSEFPVELAITRIRIAGRTHFIGHVRDISDRERAAAEHARHVLENALRADINAVLARCDTLRGMLHGCVAALVTHLDAAFARVWTVRPGSSVLELQASAGQYTRLDGAYARIPVGRLNIGRIAHERAPHLTNDVPNDPRVGDKDWARREGITAFAGYPLVAEGRVLGVMALFARRALSTDTLELLASIAVSLAQGIERQWAQEKLRRSEAYLADGQRLSRTGSWAWKPDTGERFWSKEVFRIYGFEEADVPPPRELVLQRVHPRDALRMQRTLEQCVDEGREFRFETRIQIPGSARKWIETVGHPVRDESGRVVEYIGTDIDITRRRRAQQLLRRAIRARYAAVLEERTRLARDMHDGLLQDVAGIALQLRALLPHLQSSPAIVADRWSQILELTERTSREARQAVAGMRSPLRSADVVTAIENAARRAVARSPLRLSVTVSGRARPVPRKVCDAAASIAREAVTNVVKHANAQTVKVSVVFARRRIRLGISDNGRGYSMPPDGALLDEHFGIVGMRERAGALGASLNIERAARGGTTVTVALPTIE